MRSSLKGDCFWKEGVAAWSSHYFTNKPTWMSNPTHRDIFLWDANAYGTSQPPASLSFPTYSTHARGRGKMTLLLLLQTYSILPRPQLSSMCALESCARICTHLLISHARSSNSVNQSMGLSLACSFAQATSAEAENARWSQVESSREEVDTRTHSRTNSRVGFFNLSLPHNPGAFLCMYRRDLQPTYFLRTFDFAVIRGRTKIQPLFSIQKSKLYLVYRI